ncbi:MAG: peptidoglycan-binding domain-containing protein [Nonlabens sp.]|uniref:peptidoglycan-binding domain-containing protein n=1 Tax=Nonlabens sp. TaxID=1888209 RepID=UPI003EF2D289
MKQLIIFLLVIILGFIAYDFYKDWDRFHAPEYHYTTEAAIDASYHDQAVVRDYHEAIADLNTYVKLQWTANDIDVRLPEDDDLETQQAVKEYANKLAHVTYLQQKLEQSALYKKQGWSNEQIMAFENNQSSPEALKTQSQKALMNQLFKNEVGNSQRIGSKSALTFEIQKILIDKGYEIPLDGVFAQITSTALADFEAKNNLYPDGKIDALTFDALIK